MISVSSLSKSFGARTLFTDVGFQLLPGHRYGLVGANGSGKTTLLRILTGDEPASDGTVSIPNRVTLGVLRQDQFLYENEEVLAVAMRGNAELWKAIVEKEQVLARAADHFDADRYAALEDTILRHDGYAAEARAAEILEGLGLPEVVHRRPMSTLSGGFKLRVLLAQALAGNPDALLLDEPTNHLDIVSIRWLEKFLRNFAGPVVVISHDHRFLDNVATHILDVDYQTVTLYHGNYSYFLEARHEERERREKAIESQQKEIAHHQDFVDRFKAKASKARQAQSKLRLIEKKSAAMESLAPSSRRWPNFRFTPRRPSGREVLELKGIKKAYGGNEVLHGVGLTVLRGDRLAIVGPNGIGKSTLLKIAVGATPADAGSVTWGYEVQPGYFAQDHKDQFRSGSLTALQWVAEAAPGATPQTLRSELGRVLFTGDDVEKRLESLSGGEAARLVFAHLAIEHPNVLVLDEPTNHLDLESIEALVESLRDYDGTLVFVSHDRWFVGQLASRVVEIRADGVRDYQGTWDEYLAQCGDDHLDGMGGMGKPGRRSRVASRAVRAPRSVTRDPRPTAQDSASVDALTAQIERAEQRIAEIDATLADPALYHESRADEVRALAQERATLAGSVEHLMGEWESLEDRTGGTDGADGITRATSDLA
ncbi:MAG TPA: ABC-F family ATP-binding cassette domain-containing protein [Gemmatimonadales bacterium]|nr:ABC-F family ATP-binding cassette domain-containing protein [Gemmatimonadales bacterium]